MTSAAREQLPLIPMPASVTPGDGAFLIDAATAIVLGAAAGDATVFAARQLAAEIGQAAGFAPPLRKDGDPPAAPNAIVLLLAGRDAAPDALAGVDEWGPQSYTLRITPARAVIAATTEAGLFYGVQTLRQLVRTQGRRLPALAIADRPALPHRGVMLDVSRGKVPTLATLCALADHLAHYKYNQLQLYIEHTFAFPRHPLIGAGSDPLTADDILALDRYCRERHVELVPNLQSFGHQRTLLRLPQYAHLDEVGWGWTVTPAREETYQLFDELYGDLLPAFTSRWFNVGCDETWDLGQGQSKALAEELGLGRLYVRHILRLRELAARYGRRIMVWADVLHHYPEVLPELPDDLLLLDWGYEAADHYPTAAALAAAGRAFYVCPGTSSWNTLFPRIENALANIRDFTRAGLAAGASGMLLTDWGDLGHYQPLSLSWYPYLFGAATAWTGGATAPDDFDRAVAPLWFGRPAGDASLVALRRLGRAVTGPTLALRNRSNSAYALFDDPLAGTLIATADPAALAELRDAALAAEAAWAALPDPALRHDYTFTARLVAYAAEKVLHSQAVRQALQALPDAGDRAAGLARLDAAIAGLRADEAALPALVAEFTAGWLRHARPSEMRLTLDRFAALGARYEAALAWLAEQRAAYAAGGPVDRAAASYDRAGYLVLWDESRAAILRLAELIGHEALPPDLRAVLERAG
jgi:hypothetical protein